MPYTNGMSVAIYRPEKTLANQYDGSFIAPGEEVWIVGHYDNGVLGSLANIQYYISDIQYDFSTVDEAPWINVVTPFSCAILSVPGYFSPNQQVVISGIIGSLEDVASEIFLDGAWITPHYINIRDTGLLVAGNGNTYTVGQTAEITLSITQP